MKLPFSREQFFELFASYNTTVWPAQVVLLALAVAVLAHGAFGRRPSPRLAGFVLAGLWMWMGLAYHLAFFVRINPAAWIFGAAFLIQGGLFAWYTQRERLRISLREASPHLGLVVVAYGLVGYPAVASLIGHTYPATATFGLPCPTTIFTLGLLLFARPPVPGALFVVPLAWSAVGTVAALQLGVYEDFGLPVAAAFLVVASIRRGVVARSGRAGRA